MIIISDEVDVCVDNKHGNVIIDCMYLCTYCMCMGVYMRKFYTLCVWVNVCANVCANERVMYALRICMLVKG